MFFLVEALVLTIGIALAIYKKSTLTVRDSTTFTCASYGCAFHAVLASTSGVNVALCLCAIGDSSIHPTLVLSTSIWNVCMCTAGVIGAFSMRKAMKAASLQRQIQKRINYYRTALIGIVISLILMVIAAIIPKIIYASGMLFPSSFFSLYIVCCLIISAACIVSLYKGRSDFEKAPNSPGGVQYGYYKPIIWSADDDEDEYENDFDTENEEI